LYAVYLVGMIFEGAFAPDHEMGAGDFIGDRHLGSDAGLDLAGCPAAGREAFATGGFGTGHANHFIEMGGGIGFKEQRYDDDADPTILVSPGLDLGKPKAANAGMKNILELFARKRVFEDNVGESVPAQMAIRGDQVLAKDSANFIEGGLAGLDEFAGEEVGVHDFCAVLLEECRSGGFAHADTAGQTEKIHVSAILRLGRGIGNGGFAEIGPIAMPRPQPQLRCSNERQDWKAARQRRPTLLDLDLGAVEAIRDAGRDGVGKDKGRRVRVDGSPSHEVCGVLDDDGG